MNFSRKDPIHDHDVAKVDNELAIGFDPGFESKWGIAERISWVVMVALVAAGLCGFFGRGPWSKRTVNDPDAGITVEYEKMMRYKTPAMLVVRFHPDAAQEQHLVLHIGKNLVQRLGEQRVIPQPAGSTPEKDGISCVFPMSAAGGRISQVSFALQPDFVGRTRIEIGIPGRPPFSAIVFIFP